MIWLATWIVTWYFICFIFVFCLEIKDAIKMDAAGFIIWLGITLINAPGCAARTLMAEA